MIQLHRRRFVRLITAVVATTALGSLAGCGKKGGTKPPSKDSTFPKTYPSGSRQSDAPPKTGVTQAARS